MLSLLRRSCPKLRLKPGYIFGYPGPITARRQYAFSTATGLYGFDHLKTPKGFRRFVDDAIERSGELVAYISGMPSSAEIIRAMDEISNTVCSVIDSAELCRQTHPDREFVEEAIKASIRVNEYLHYLNTNHTLYNAVIKAEQEGNLLTDEAHRVAHYLRLDFERSGIHLSAEKVDRVNRLSIDISQLCRQFNQNIVNDPGTVDIFLASLIPRNLHHLLKPIYRSTSVVSKDSWRPGGTMNEKGFRITTDPHTLSCVLQGAPNDEVWKMAYIKGNSVPHANLGVLDQLIASRHELAQVHCKGNSSFDNRKSLTEHFDTIHDKTHKLCGEKLLCKEPVYPNHEIHICIPYGVSRINKNELKKKEKKKKNQEE